jgi:hypothetical protein
MTDKFIFFISVSIKFNFESEFYASSGIIQLHGPKLQHIEKRQKDSFQLHDAGVYIMPIFP